MDSEMIWNWRGAIQDACKGEYEWQGRMFIQRLEDHQRKYPAFIPERVANMFLDAPPKVRGWYCYQPISKFTKSIHKAASIASLARNEHL